MYHCKFVDGSKQGNKQPMLCKKKYWLGFGNNKTITINKKNKNERRSNNYPAAELRQRKYACQF